MPETLLTWEKVARHFLEVAQNYVSVDIEQLVDVAEVAEVVHRESRRRLTGRR